jgi:hypothetical protein
MAEPWTWRGSSVDGERIITPASDDWLWRGSPVEVIETAARVTGPRIWRGSLVPDRVWIDDDGLLHRGERWIALPELEWRIMGLLVERFGQLVSRSELADAGWGPGAETGPKLTRRMTRARRRISPLDLGIQGVSSRGYFLRRNDPAVEDRRSVQP